MLQLTIIGISMIIGLVCLTGFNTAKSDLEKLYANPKLWPAGIQEQKIRSREEMKPVHFRGAVFFLILVPVSCLISFAF